MIAAAAEQSELFDPLLHGGASLQDRQGLLGLPVIREAGLSRESPYSDRTRDALLEVLFAARSRLLILPIQDILGWRDRINTPALVSDANWTWRLPWAVEDLMTDPAAVERAAFLRELSRRYGRSL